MQSFWCCHLLDIHVEHVHSVCCAGALRMCHLCEDTARAGGGILHITPWPLNKDSKTRCLIIEPNAKTWAPLMKLVWHFVPDHVLQKFPIHPILPCFCLNLHRESRVHCVAFPLSPIQQPIDRLVHKQHKHVNMGARACWFSRPKQAQFTQKHMEQKREKKTQKTLDAGGSRSSSGGKRIRERDAVITLKVVLFC